jgi:hypothetical protein
VQLAAAATVLRQTAGLPLPDARTDCYLASARHLGEPAVARLWAQGLAMSSETAVALAVNAPTTNSTRRRQSRPGHRTSTRDSSPATQPPRRQTNPAHPRNLPGKRPPTAARSPTCKAYALSPT